MVLCIDTLILSLPLFYLFFVSFYFYTLNITQRDFRSYCHSSPSIRLHHNSNNNNNLYFPFFLLELIRLQTSRNVLFCVKWLISEVEQGATAINPSAVQRCIDLYIVLCTLSLSFILLQKFLLFM